MFICKLNALMTVLFRQLHDQSFNSQLNLEKLFLHPPLYPLTICFSYQFKIKKKFSNAQKQLKKIIVYQLLEFVHINKMILRLKFLI